jgi:hypothetical protein
MRRARLELGVLSRWHMLVFQRVQLWCLPSLRWVPSLACYFEATRFYTMINQAIPIDKSYSAVIFDYSAAMI